MSLCLQGPSHRQFSHKTLSLCHVIIFFSLDITTSEVSFLWFLAALVNYLPRALFVIISLFPPPFSFCKTHFLSSILSVTSHSIWDLGGHYECMGWAFSGA